MPEINRPKKRRVPDSIDGMVTPRKSPLAAPQYYQSSSARTPGPRRPIPTQVNRRRPHLADPDLKRTESNKPVAEIGDFSGLSMQDVEADFLPNRKSKDKKSKKDKNDSRKRRHFWKNRSKKFKAFIIIMLILLGLGGFLGARIYSFFNSVFGRNVGNGSSAALSDKPDPKNFKTEGDGNFNVLLLGRGGDENEAPDLTDTIVIASIDIQNQTASLLSIPRDTWVNIDGDTMKINAAYSTAKQQATYNGKNKDEAENAGISSAISAARNVAGVPIHKYVLSDYKAFRDVVNALGGVNVDVTSPIIDRFTGWTFQAGPQTMNGDRALQYARTRQGSARGDFDRNENQRKLLVAIRQKAMSTGIVANPVKLNNLANAVQKNIRTDLTLDEARTLFNKTKNLSDSNIKSLDLAKPDAPLITTGNIGGQSIVRPVAGLFDYSKIRAYARTNMIDPFLKKEAPTVAIYNGSGRSGLATSVGDILSGYGYNVVIKESSKEPQQQTLVVKKTQESKPYTERFLSVRFSKPISSDLPNSVLPTASNTATTSSNTAPPTADFIIVLGSDFKIPSGPTW
jgi:LCP family protein required for cell wall assembly